MNALALDRSRQPLRGVGVLPEGEGGGDQADHRLRGLRRPGQPVPQRSRQHEGGQLPSDPLAENLDGLPEPPEAGLVGLPGGFLFPPADRQATPRGPQRRADLPERLRFQRAEPGAVGRARAGPRQGDARGRLVPLGVRRSILHRDPGQRDGDPAGGDARGGRSRPAHGHPAGGHQRRALRGPRRRRRPGHPPLRQHRQVPHRREADEDGDPGVLSPQPGADVPGVRRLRGGAAMQPGDRRPRRVEPGVGAAALPGLRAARRQDVRAVPPRLVP